jgi:hypothetical protein
MWPYFACVRTSHDEDIVTAVHKLQGNSQQEKYLDIGIKMKLSF